MERKVSNDSTRNNMEDKIVCATTDDISVLGLSVRPHNALKRGGIADVGHLIVLGVDELFAVRNLGEKGIAEIKERIAQVELLDELPPAPRHDSKGEWSGEPQILIDLGPPKIPLHEVVDWQKVMLGKQIEAGTLHPRLQVDGYTLGELLRLSSRKDGLYERLLKILTAPISITQELERLIVNFPQRELHILCRRFGCNRQTLEEIANDVGVTRERVRQIEQQATRKIGRSMIANRLYRVQSAVLIADDTTMSFNNWTSRLLHSGLLGDWSREQFHDVGRIDLLIALLRILEAREPSIEIPEALKNMINLHREGMSSAPARTVNLLNRYRGPVERLVKRQLRYSGAVSIEWLVNQDIVHFWADDLRDVLNHNGFVSLDDNWYTSFIYSPDRIEKNSVLHKSLQKMFQVCGPLSIQDVYFGVEHTLIKTDFPKPPLAILGKILEAHGYSSEDGLWYWEGTTNEELNNGEKIIVQVLNENGGVAHHSQLATSLLNSSLSFPSLHATLARSPLFDNFERTLYKLRGSQPKQPAIERARSQGERIPVSLEHRFDLDGNIIVLASLGTLALGNGTITSDRLPAIMGSWRLGSNDSDPREVEVTENEIKGLRHSLELLRCEVGDRIKLTFDTDSRDVSVALVEVTG